MLSGGDILIRSLQEENVEYVFPPEHKQLKRYLIYFILKKPLNSLNLLLYIIFRQHSNKKNISKDISIYLRAIYLAGKLKDNSIKHIHSPWANQQAFVALIASKLLGIKFSVQARAYDIHKNSQKFGIKEIFENAEVIVTNTEYNKMYINTIITELLLVT